MRPSEQNTCERFVRLTGLNGWRSALALLTVTVACTPTASSPDTGAGGEADAYVDDGAQPPNDAGADAPMPSDAGALALRGRIAVLTGATPQVVPAFYAANGVWYSAAGERCSLTSVDANCLLSVCSAALESTNVDPGAIDVTIAGGATVTASPSSPGNYPMTVGTWTTGDTVMVHAAGATFPGFDVTLTLPSAAASWTAPSAPGDATGLTVTWTPLAEHVQLSLRNGVSPNERRALLCIYDGAPGQVTIPRAALDALGGGNAVLSVASATTATMALSGANIDVLGLASDETTASVSWN